MSGSGPSEVGLAVGLPLDVGGGDGLLDGRLLVGLIADLTVERRPVDRLQGSCRARGAQPWPTLGFVRLLCTLDLINGL